MRLFVAIDCNPIGAELKALQRPFSSLKARFADDFHLTLKFIGKVDAEECAWIMQQLDTISSPRFALKINRLGTFKSYSQKVIWCGLEDCLGLNNLYKEVEQVLAAHYSGSMAFRPHITLMRIKHPHKIAAKHRELIEAELKKDIAQTAVEVNRFVLFESHITPRGPIYRVVKDYPLGGIWRDE